MSSARHTEAASRKPKSIAEALELSENRARAIGPSRRIKSHTEAIMIA